MIKNKLRSLGERRRLRRVTLPWAELEAEAARQGCSPADIFFDRAGRQPTTPPHENTSPAGTRYQCGGPVVGVGRARPIKQE
jgi:hypothetical protein